MSTAGAVVLFVLCWAVSTAALAALGIVFIAALIMGLALTICGIVVIDFVDDF